MDELIMTVIWETGVFEKVPFWKRDIHRFHKVEFARITATEAENGVPETSYQLVKIGDYGTTGLAGFTNHIKNVTHELIKDMLNPARNPRFYCPKHIFREMLFKDCYFADVYHLVREDSELGKLVRRTALPDMWTLKEISSWINLWNARHESESVDPHVANRLSCSIWKERAASVLTADSRYQYHYMAIEPLVYALGSSRTQRRLARSPKLWPNALISYLEREVLYLE